MTMSQDIQVHSIHCLNDYVLSDAVAECTAEKRAVTMTMNRLNKMHCVQCALLLLVDVVTAIVVIAVVVVVGMNHTDVNFNFKSTLPA